MGGEWALELADLLLRHLNFGTSVTAENELIENMVWRWGTSSGRGVANLRKTGGAGESISGNAVEGSFRASPLCALVFPDQRRFLYLVLIQPNVHQSETVICHGFDNSGRIREELLGDVSYSRAGQDKDLAPAHPDLGIRNTENILTCVCQGWATAESFQITIANVDEVSHFM